MARMQFAGISISTDAPWLPNRFHGKAVQEGQNKFLGTLWNTYAFFVLYANIDNFDPTKYTLDYEKLPVMDKWLLSKMNSMVKAVETIWVITGSRRLHVHLRSSSMI